MRILIDFNVVCNFYWSKQSRKFTISNPKNQENWQNFTLIRKGGQIFIPRVQIRIDLNVVRNYTWFD